ncbi:HET domain-containing protein [Fusarium sp. Ph1]|nr:HET domain-containing protein [Fusarium sp. Ph1]
MAESTAPTTAVPNLYHPLDADIHELRLIKIYPSEDSDSPIQVKIFPCRFEDVRGQFIPLSYVWGDPTDTEIIIINGVPRKIPNNLALFLQQVRVLLPCILAKISWDKPALFWADAICINQNDIEERNHQVQFMRSIYGSASVVLAWLGQAEDSHLAANIVDACVTWLNACKEKNPDLVNTWRQDPNCDGWMERYPDFWTFSGGVEKMNPHWTSIRKLLRSPYWRRTWIFQEIALPVDTLLIYGSTLIRLSSFEALLMWMMQFMRRAASDYPFLDPGNYQELQLALHLVVSGASHWIMTPLGTRKRLTNQRRPTLALVPILAKLRASDPRDKIFGLLGVMDTHLVADYNKPIDQVYCEFVSAWIREAQDLNFLLEAYHMPPMEGSTGQPELPSWAPNWDAISRVLDMRYSMLSVFPIGHFLGTERPQASKHLPIDPAHMNPSSRILTATGVVCGEVEEAYPAWKDSEGELAIGTSFFDLVQRYTDRSRLEGHGRSRRHILQILFRTILQDSSLLSMSVPLLHSDETSFHAWGISFLLCLARYYAANCDPPAQNFDYLAAAFLPRLGIPHGPEFSRFWREEIFGDVELGGADAAHWQDAGAAFRWVWETRRAELESIPGRLLSFFALSVKFITRDNYMGVASSAEVGDKVVVLAGCNVPVLLRPKGNHYEHISACYVVGFMDGEAKEMVDRGEAKLETFEIH